MLAGRGQVPLEKAKVEEIEAATRGLLRTSEKEPHAKVSPLIKRVTAQLKSKSLRGVAARVSGGKLFLGAIPPESLEELCRALLQVKLDNVR